MLWSIPAISGFTTALAALGWFVLVNALAERLASRRSWFAFPLYMAAGIASALPVVVSAAFTVFAAVKAVSA